MQQGNEKATGAEGRWLGTVRHSHPQTRLVIRLRD